MARNASGSDGKPTKTPTRRRTDKARQAATTSSNDNGGVRTIEGVSLSDTASTPAPSEVQRRAYELFLQRGGGHGRDLDDWYEAERQLRQGH